MAEGCGEALAQTPGCGLWASLCRLPGSICTPLETSDLLPLVCVYHHPAGIGECLKACFREGLGDFSEAVVKERGEDVMR